MFKLWKLSSAIFTLQIMAFLSGLAEGSWLLGLILAFMLPSVLCIIFRNHEMFDLYDICRSAAAAAAGAIVISGFWLLPVEMMPISSVLSVLVLMFFWYGIRLFAQDAAAGCSTNLPEDLGIGSWVAMPFGIGAVAGMIFFLMRLLDETDVDRIIGR